VNTSVRISVRATFNDTLRRFSELRESLAKMAAVADKSSGAVDRLGTRIARNEAELRGYTEAMMNAGVATQRFTGPLEGMITLQQRARVATDQSTMAVGRHTAALAAWDTRMINAGKRGQWLGSILTYNLTVPLAAGFYLVMKREMEFQQALADLRGTLLDVTDEGEGLAAAQRRIAHDTETLSKIMIVESSYFGISRVEVAKLTTELGRAGVQGKSLVTDTESILTIMRAFSLGTDEATKALLQLRITYGLTSTESREALAVLGVAAQTTRADFSSLIAGFVRAGPVAAQMGIDVRHLAAELAVMSQAGFAGGESGNALNFALTRLIKPTPEATKLMAQLGINVQSAAWQARNGAERFELLAEKLKTASDGQIALADAVIFGARQAPKLAAEIATIRKGVGVYADVLDKTADSQKNLAYLNDQLAIQLKNPSVQFQILRANISNAARTIASNATPALLGLVGALVALSQSFAGLDPGTQKLITIGVVILALAGPLLKIISLTEIFVGLVGKGFRGLATVTGGALAIFRERAVEAATIQQMAADEMLVTATTYQAESVARQQAYAAEIVTINAEMVAAMEAENGEMVLALGAQLATLNAAIAEEMAVAGGAVEAAAAIEAEALATTGGAMTAVAAPIAGLIATLAAVIAAVYLFHDQFLAIFMNLVRAFGFIAHAIYQLFSWLNPWARHSPSLVENVSSGVDRMIKDFSRLSYIKPIMDGVADTVRNLNSAASSMSGGTGDYKIDKGRADVAKGGNAGALRAYDAGIVQLRRLNDALADVAAQYQRQAAVVAVAKAALDAANTTLDGASDRLDKLKDQQKALEEQMRVLGNPAALRSQAKALDEMARAIAQNGNADLAKRFHDQALALDAQAKAAGEVQGQIDDLTSQIEAQEAVVKRLTEARDALADTYDTENEKLSDLKDGYGEIKNAINDVESAMSDLTQTTNAANDAAKGIAETFKNAAAGDFNSPLGGALKNDMGDLDKLLADLQKSKALHFEMPSMGLGNFFDDLKDSWNEGWADFGKRDGFAAVFGFGKNWPGWLQAASLVALVATGRVLLGALRTLFIGRLFPFIAAQWLRLNIAMAAGLGRVVGTLEAMMGGLIGRLTTRFAFLRAAVLGPIGAIVALGAAVAVAAFKIKDATDKAVDWAVGIYDGIGTLKEAADAHDTYTKAVHKATDNTDGFIGSLRMGWRALNGVAEKGLAAQAALDQLDAKIAQITETEGELSRITGLSTTQIEDLANAAGIDLTGSFAAALIQIRELNTAGNGNIRVIEKIAKAADIFSDSAATATDRAKALRDVFDEINNNGMDLGRTTDDLQKKLNDVANTAPDASRALKGTSDAALTNRDSLREMVLKVEDVLVAQQQNGASNDVLRGNYEKLRKKVIDVYTAHGYNRKEVEKLLDQYGLTPSLIDAIVKKYPSLNNAVKVSGDKFDIITVKVQGLNVALKTTGTYLMDIVTGLAAMPTTSGPQSWQDLLNPHAAGGVLDKGWNLVGEQGPELIRNSTSAAYVYTADQTRAMLSGNSEGSTYNDNRQDITVELTEVKNADPHYIAAQVAFALRGA
jgi:TP901 family phage tail tape measure protein